jgi:hypothetical protein
MRRIVAFALLVCAACLGAGCATDPRLAAGPWWMAKDMATDISDPNFSNQNVQAPVPNGGTPSGPTR